MWSECVLSSKREKERRKNKATEPRESPNCSWALIKKSKCEIVNANPMHSYFPPNPNPSPLNCFGELLSVLFSFSRNPKDWNYDMRLRFLFGSLALVVVSSMA